MGRSSRVVIWNAPALARRFYRFATVALACWARKSGAILGLAGIVGTAGGILWAQLPALPAAVEANAQERAAVEASVHYAACDEVRLLGKAPLYAGQPGYSPRMDGDGDGIACEPRRY